MNHLINMENGTEMVIWYEELDLDGMKNWIWTGVENGAFDGMENGKICKFSLDS